MIFLGLDIGSSSVKVALLDGETGRCLGAVQQPEQEFKIDAPQSGWAEQAPTMWWDATVAGIKQLIAQNPGAGERISAIGISYQMHGLVVVDKQGEVLHPSIIWCDSRAAQTGAAAYAELGEQWCMSNLLNSPGNFTFAKLKWLAENRPEVFAKIDKIMLPGDYIAMRLTGETTTTPSGLSEGVMWNFQNQSAAVDVFDRLGVDPNLIPAIKPNFGEAGQVSSEVANALGINPAAKLTYRAGDQPNNAFSLNVLESGEFATTAGTSGVVYAVTDKNISDTQQRINSFLHVNHQPQSPTVGLLACINGAGRMNSWLRNLFLEAGSDISYASMSNVANKAPIGSEGLVVHPFGNGGERMFGNKLLQAEISGLDLNRHGLSHISRGVQEGVAFAMAMGTEMINNMGVAAHVIRAGKANMFLSPVFSAAFVNATGTPVELYDTNGAEGAARGAGWASGYYTSREEAFSCLEKLSVIEPDQTTAQQYQDAYASWKNKLAL